MISEQSVRRAIAHLCAFGDTDLFPLLPEMKFLSGSADELVRDCAALNLGRYTPAGVTETLTPKSRLGFRIAHQLTPSDNLIYLAATLDCAERLEATRAHPDNNIAFAYRFDPTGGERIFAKSRGYHDWITYLGDFAKEDNPFENSGTVVVTDVSDFYQRIYFHRIENILADAESPRDAANLVKKIIKVSRARQSYGLPVGTTASRLLAECILNDTDILINGMGVKFTRYVDDYRLLVPSERQGHTILCKLAEHLMVTEGLSLNANKTRLIPLSDLHGQSEARLRDVFTTKERHAIESYIRLNYGDADEEEDVAETMFLEAPDLLDKMKELSSRPELDISTFKAILRALRFLPAIDVRPLLEEHSNLLYFIPREFCLVIRAAAKNDNFDADYCKQRVLQLLQMEPFSDLAFVRMWLLDLFVTGALSGSIADFSDYDFSRSVVEKRAELFVRGLNNDRPFFRARRTRLGDLGEWEKSATMLAAMCLPNDEYRAWLDVAVAQLSTPFAQTYVNWLKRSHGNLAAILTPTV